MILRTYACETCGHMVEVELRQEQWNVEPPTCPMCAQQTHQEFVPPAIGGSHRARATKLAETIAAEDYGVADMQRDNREGGRPKVRFKDDNRPPSTWGAQQAALEQAVALGRESRLKYGSGLEILQHNLKTGVQPDLIELSKRRSAKVW